MPTYTMHYSNTVNSPPFGDSPSITTDNLDEAVHFAEGHFIPPPHQPPVGDMRGYCICDEDKHMVVPWREGGQA